MSRYALKPGSETGVRVVHAASGETATTSGRLLDNLTTGAADDIVRQLDRLDTVKQEHVEGALQRNDLTAILGNSNNPRTEGT